MFTALTNGVATSAAYIAIGLALSADVAVSQPSYVNQSDAQILCNCTPPDNNAINADFDTLPLAQQDERVFESVVINSPTINSAANSSKLTLAALVAMAERSPRELIARIHAGDMSAGLRARAAEAMGRVADCDIAVPVLLTLLHDKDIVVQEGAIYGLSRHMTSSVREALQLVIDDDSAHPIIRNIAADAIEG